MHAQGHLPPAPVLHQSLQPPVHPTDEASLVDAQKRNNKCGPPLGPAAPDYIINIYNMGMKLFPSSGNSIFQTEKMSAEWSSGQDPPSQQYHKADTPSITEESPACCPGAEQKHSDCLERPLSDHRLHHPPPTPTDMCRWTQRLRNTHIHTCMHTHIHAHRHNSVHNKVWS